MYFQQYKLEVALDRSAGLQATAAAVQGASAVAKLVANVAQIRADVARLSAICKNLQLIWMNERIAQTARSMTPLLKTVAGHPAGVVPRDPALLALVGAEPVPVGAALPAALSFPAGGAWTHAQIMGLTSAQLDDLEWFYNERFGGADITLRVQSFLSFL